MAPKKKTSPEKKASPEKKHLLGPEKQSEFAEFNESNFDSDFDSNGNTSDGWDDDQELSNELQNEMYKAGCGGLYVLFCDPALK